MTLSQVSKNQQVTVVSLDMVKTGADRLTALGIFPGSRVRVVDNSLKDVAVVERFGSRLALGRGLARFIVVE